MFWWGGPGWLFGLGNAIFWVALIVVAVLLLRRELPHVRWPESQPPALRLLEERYARGEISREEFLERRAVLSGAGAPAPPPQGAGPAGPQEPTQPL